MKTASALAAGRHPMLKFIDLPFTVLAVAAAAPAKPQARCGPKMLRFGCDGNCNKVIVSLRDGKMHFARAVYNDLFT